MYNVWQELAGLGRDGLLAKQRSLFKNNFTGVGEKLKTFNESNDIFARYYERTNEYPRYPVPPSADVFLNIEENFLNTPTSKTANLEKYSKHIAHSSKHFISFIKFNLLNASRKLRFNRYVAKQKVN